jgi:hypothetical protein
MIIVRVRLATGGTICGDHAPYEKYFNISNIHEKTAAEVVEYLKKAICEFIMHGYLPNRTDTPDTYHGDTLVHFLCRMLAYIVNVINMYPYHAT